MLTNKKVQITIKRMFKCLIVFMKKIFKLEDLDCANCANKIEEKIREIEGVKNVSVSFMAQKLSLEAPDELFEKILEEAKKIVKKIEPDVNFID